MNTLPINLEDSTMCPSGTEGIMFKYPLYKKKINTKVKKRGVGFTRKQKGRK